MRSFKKVIENVFIHNQLKFERSSNDLIMNSKGVEAWIHDNRRKDKSQDKQKSRWPHKVLIPRPFPQRLYSQYFWLTLGLVHPRINILEFHPMEQRQGSGCNGPIWDLLEFPKKGDASEEHVDIVINPIVSLHQCIAALVAIEAVFDLQAWDDEVDQIQHQEDR